MTAGLAPSWAGRTAGCARCYGNGSISRGTVRRAGGHLGPQAGGEDAPQRQGHLDALGRGRLKDACTCSLVEAGRATSGGANAAHRGSTGTARHGSQGPGRACCTRKARLQRTGCHRCRSPARSRHSWRRRRPRTCCTQPLCQPTCTWAGCRRATAGRPALVPVDGPHAGQQLDQAAVQQRVAVRDLLCSRPTGGASDSCTALWRAPGRQRRTSVQQVVLCATGPLGVCALHAEHARPCALQSQPVSAAASARAWSRAVVKPKAYRPSGPTSATLQQRTASATGGLDQEAHEACAMASPQGVDARGIPQLVVGCERGGEALEAVRLRPRRSPSA